jgi:hypothetical protein
MIKRTESLADLNKEAWRVLVKELGVAKAIRFLGQFDTGSGNYATDRDAWQEGLSVEKIVGGIERRKKRKQVEKPKQTLARRKKRSLG